MKNFKKLMTICLVIVTSQSLATEKITGIYHVVGGDYYCSEILEFEIFKVFDEIEVTLTQPRYTDRKFYKNVNKGKSHSFKGSNGITTDVKYTLKDGVLSFWSRSYLFFPGAYKKALDVLTVKNGLLDYSFTTFGSTKCTLRKR